MFVRCQLSSGEFTYSWKHTCTVYLIPVSQRLSLCNRCRMAMYCAFFDMHLFMAFCSRQTPESFWVTCSGHHFNMHPIIICPKGGMNLNFVNKVMNRALLWAWPLLSLASLQLFYWIQVLFTSILWIDVIALLCTNSTLWATLSLHCKCSVLLQDIPILLLTLFYFQLCLDSRTLETLCTSLQTQPLCKNWPVF